jgi:hypothetical protein
MSNQPTRRRRASRAAARKLAVAAALAALIATLGAGQALAGPPDERVLERQARIDRQKAAASQADEQGEADKSVQGPSTPFPRRFFKPEPPMDTGSRLDVDERATPVPAPPATDQDGLVIGLTVAALLLAAGAVTTWRIYRRPRPEPTG